MPESFNNRAVGLSADVLLYLIADRKLLGHVPTMVPGRATHNLNLLVWIAQNRGASVVERQSKSNPAFLSPEKD